MVYRINPEGCLYGITFIDHTTRTVFNGSRLGKAFSANVFNELFNNPDADRIRLIPLAQQDTPRLEREERPEDAEYRQQENQGYNQSELSGSLIDTSALGGPSGCTVLPVAYGAGFDIAKSIVMRHHGQPSSAMAFITRLRSCFSRSCTCSGKS